MSVLPSELVSSAAPPIGWMLRESGHRWYSQQLESNMSSKHPERKSLQQEERQDPPSVLA